MGVCGMGGSDPSASLGMTVKGLGMTVKGLGMTVKGLGMTVKGLRTMRTRVRDEIGGPVISVRECKLLADHVRAA